MITICPKCALTLSVSATDLRIAQGQVRCGRCMTVFNALIALYDEPQGRRTIPRSDTPVEGDDAADNARSLPGVAAVDAAPLADAAARAAEPPADDLASADVNAAVTETAIPQQPTPLPVEEVFEAANDETVDDLVITELTVMDQPLAADEPNEDFGSVRVVIASHAAPQLEALDFSGTAVLASRPTTGLLAQLQSGAEPPNLNAPDLDPPDTDELELEAPLERDLALQIEPAFAPSPRQRHRRFWLSAAALCGIVLALQLLHVNRAALARIDGVGPAVSALYATLGMPIRPHWDVRAYEVRQQGATGAADATEPLTLRASIVNRAPRSQPLPLLRVTLQDRFGNKIALRDLQPKEYLTQRRSGALLQPGQRVDAEVAMADPGGKAVGFEIDACLQTLPGRYRCANDEPLESGGVDHTVSAR